MRMDEKLSTKRLILDNYTKILYSLGMIGGRIYSGAKPVGEMHGKG